MNEIEVNQTGPYNALKRAWAILCQLPQATAIDKKHAQAWLSYVAANDPERVEWHAARASGIGGSEAGAVLAWYSGEIKARKGATSLVKDKLLLRTPERANADMMRGTVLEDHIRIVFETRLDKEGRQWKRRPDLEAAVNAATPQQYPWMRANVDAIYDVDGAMVIVDFKAPSETSLITQLRTEGNDEYKAQLNHYAIVADAAGFPPAALWLVLYDYVRVATDGVQIVDVKLDPMMQQAIVEGSAELWNEWIMKGQIPPFAIREEAEPSTAPPQDIQYAAVRASRSKLLAEAALKEYERCRTEVSDWVSKQGELGELPLFLGPVEPEGKGLLKVTAKRNLLDMDEAVGRLYDLGLQDTDIDELKVIGTYKDASVLADRYDTLRSVCMGILGTLAKNELPDTDTLALLAKQLDKTPARNSDTFNPESVRRALVACGEMPYEFEREVVSAVVDRRDRSDTEMTVSHAEDALASFLESTPIPEPTSSFMNSVPGASF